MADEFWELYKHPLWQKKRLEIMQRARFRCKRCFSDDVTLNVHHSYYERDKAPWEYPNWSLHCYCEPCHQEVAKELQEIKELLARLHGEQGDRIIGYLKGLELSMWADRHTVGNNLMAKGVGDAWWIDGDRLFDFMSEVNDFEVSHTLLKHIKQHPFAEEPGPIDGLLASLC
jgi:hypothetical protein